MIPVFGSQSSTLEQRNLFQEAMLRIMSRRCRYDGEARSFLQALHEQKPEAPKPIYRAPLTDVVRRS